ncbi:MAG: hypothetical protein LBK82_02305 [Planctomycetaceae bacterium]|jgi:hypothetical protein|nr:hypothetical protein [Planctomycetaceae bacterium]
MKAQFILVIFSILALTNVGILKLADGRIQVIEGDRIRNPNQYNENQQHWKHGVLTDDYDTAAAYAVHRRRRNGDFAFERGLFRRNI